MILNLKNNFESKKAQEYFDKLLKAEYKIELKRVLPRRTINQNKYLHILFQLIALELGYTAMEAKQLVKINCPSMHYDKHGETFLRSTSGLSTGEMKNLIDWIRNQTNSWGYLPSPEEFKSQYDDILNHVKNNQQYL